MTTPNVANMLRVPGKLVHSPSTLSGSFPYGGTGLGVFTSVTIQPVQLHCPIVAEEYGGVQTDAVYGGEQMRLVATLREFDADSLGTIFPCYAAGNSGGPTLVGDVDGSARAGSRLGSLAKVLLFAPDSPDAGGPWLLARRALPLVNETAAMALRGNETWGVSVMFALTPDSSGRQFSIGARRDITL